MAKAGDDRPRIAFIHGLESGPGSYKAQMLAKIGVVRCIQMPLKHLTSLWRNPWFSAAFVIGILLLIGLLWLGLVLMVQDQMEGWLRVLIWLGCVIVGIGGIVRLLQHGVRYIMQQCVLSQCEMLSEFDPTVMVASSFGGAVALQLLNSGLWSGPTVLLNSAHAQIAWYAGADDSCARISLHTAAALACKASSFDRQAKLVADWIGSDCASITSHTVLPEVTEAKVRSRAVIRPVGVTSADAATSSSRQTVMHSGSQWSLARGTENARMAACRASYSADTLGMLLGWASTPSFTEEGLMLRGLLESICLEQLSPVQSTKSWVGGLASADGVDAIAFEAREHSLLESCLVVLWGSACDSRGGRSLHDGADAVSERLRVSRTHRKQLSLVVVGSTEDTVVSPADSVTLVEDTVHCVNALASRDGTGVTTARVALFNPPGSHSLRNLLTHEDLASLCAAAVALSEEEDT